MEAVRRIHQENQECYGSRRMSRQLKAEGYRVGRFKTRRLMQVASVKVRQNKQWVRTTQTDPGLPVAPNLLNRQFDVKAPNQVWVTDITYLATATGWAYLAVVLDLFSRRVVGWAVSDHMRTELVQQALQQAIRLRHPNPGLIHHSERAGRVAGPSMRATITSTCCKLMRCNLPGVAKATATIRPSVSGSFVL